MSQNRGQSPRRRTPTPTLTIGYGPHSHVTVPRFIQYACEQRRFETFAGWTGPPTLLRDLAAAGFFYIGVGDQVTCYECAVRIGRWEEGEDPVASHRRWQPNCRFVQTLPIVDITLTPVPAPTPAEQPGRGSLLMDGNYFVIPDPPAEQSSPKVPQFLKLGHLNLAKPRGPMYPECSSYERRLESFHDWPTTNLQSKERLAEAGFLYANCNDQTLCFHCGGGLKYWIKEDDPWVEHAKWFNKCYWLWSVKGQSFIDRVQEQMGIPILPDNPEPPERVIRVSECEREPEICREEGSDAETVVESTWGTEDQNRCKICLCEELGIVFLPCGHLVACAKCAPSLTRCAVCRELIVLVARAIIS
ncbi:baculoviral IAP repeat-containing protein 7-B-like [Microplitis demolitor]|uniref:baculoviral IAP repeat-containing protein 7-B-like n=1 Tax=Microplitis demolitor TaxID=69319 RepID=UPI00235B6F46|nr:baculoviral IAP repeat-containing protein 7-B-like [Microplitis demolitor]